MPIYNYQAFDSEGTLHKGNKDAASESEVRQFLRTKGLFPKEIRSSRFTSVKLTGDEKLGKKKTAKIFLSERNFWKSSHAIYTSIGGFTGCSHSL